MRGGRGVVRVGSILVAALLLGACGSAEPSNTVGGGDLPTTFDESIIEKAKAERSMLIYYASGDQEAVPWIAEFEKEYGIAVDRYRASTSTVLQRFEQEAGSGAQTADVVVMSGIDVFARLRDSGLIAEFTPSNGGSLRSDMMIEGYGYPLQFFIEALTWNDSVATDAEQTILEGGYGALFTSGHDWGSGRIGVTVPHSSNAFYATYKLITDRHGWGFWEELKKYDPVFYNSSIPMGDGLLRGEHALVIAQNDSQSSIALADGSPLRWVYDGESVSVPMLIAVSKDATSPYAARLFVQWATSNQGLGLFTDLAASHSVADGINDGGMAPEQDWYEPYGDLWLEWMTDSTFQDERQDFLDRWSEAVGYSE